MNLNKPLTLIKSQDMCIQQVRYNNSFKTINNNNIGLGLNIILSL